MGKEKSLERCYNCGCDFTSENISTREHIPMKCLYKGITKTRKHITVPACRYCNENYSHIDHKMRNLIAVLGLVKQKQELRNLIEASGRSYLRDEEFRSWFLKNKDDSLSINFSTEDFNILHIKNFKGLFYYEFGYPISDKFQCFCLSDNGIIDEQKSNVNKIINVSRQRSIRYENWEYSGDLNVFKYRISLNYDYLSPKTLIDDDIIFCDMIYHDLVYAIVVACNNQVSQRLRSVGSVL